MSSKRSSSSTRWVRGARPSPSDREGPAGRLARIAGVQKVPNARLDLFVARDFLDDEICAALIERIDARRRPSEIADDIGVADFRTSETCDLDWRDPVVAEADRRIAALLGLDLAASEPLQGQRYAAGQEFKPHTDTFEPGGYDYYVHTADSGQRTWTAMVYLNRPEDGGATRFKAIGKTIQPEAGKLVTWNNLLADGTPNPTTLHQGMKVRRGVKYIITKWFRERPPG
jgi:prolyl 4-hydroxylase